MATLKSLLVKLGVDSKDLEKGLIVADKKISKLERTFGGLSKAGGTILMGAGVAVLGGGIALGVLGKEALMAAGRVDQLKGVNKVLGENLGISNTLIREQALAMRKQGIEAAVAEETLAKMMQAELDLASAVDIASIAQNAAVIAGSNSSESMSALVHGITTLDTEVLRGQGLIIDANKAYEAMAKSLDTTADSLTGAQKQQAMMNAVRAAGAKIEGTYDESMKNPIKQMGSMKRLINDIAVAAGGPFLEGFSSIISALSSGVKWFGAAVDEGGELRHFLDAAGAWFKKFVDTAIKKFPIFLSNMKKAFNWLKENKGVVVGALAAMGVAVLAFGINVAIAAWTALAPMLPVIALMLAIAAVAYLVYEAWTNNWGGIQEKTAVVIEWIVNAFNWLKDGIIAVWNTFVGIFTPLVEAFQAAFAGDWTLFGEKIREYWDGIWTLVTTALSNAFELIKTVVMEFLPKIKEWFTSVDWGEVGLNIIKGIAKGITGAAQFIKDAAINAAMAAWDAAKGFLGIASESKLFAELGKFSMMGMAGGIDDYARVPAAATAEATRGIAVTAGQADYPAAAPSQPVLDEAKLSRMIRDAILKVMEL